MDTPHTQDIKELGSNCLNQAISMMKERDKRRFRWRSIEAVELVIQNINQLDVPKEIKQQIFSAFLPKFNDAVGSIDEELVNESFNTQQGTSCPNITQNKEVQS